MKAKGAAMLAAPLIGLIFTFTVIFSFLMIPNIFKYQTARVIQTAYEYDNAQLTLIVLLFSTENGKPVSRLITEHILTNKPNDMKFLSEKLDKLVESKCYKLSTSSETLAENTNPDCNPSKYKVEVELPLPYNLGKKTEKITLVMN